MDLSTLYHQCLDGLDIKKLFWPDGANNPPKFDRAELMTIWEKKAEVYSVFDGNHRLSLFLKNRITTWNCRVISKKFKMTEIDIRKMINMMYCSAYFLF